MIANTTPRKNIAGTIVVLHGVGAHAGAGMKRGTLVFPGLDRDPEDVLLPSFAPAGRFPAPFLSLYAMQLSVWGFVVPRSVSLGLLDRYNGDMVVDGHGEVLAALQAKYGQETRREQVQSVGATVSQESTRSAVIAVLGASLAILIYLTLAFRKAPHPIRYGVCAIVAVLYRRGDGADDTIHALRHARLSTAESGFRRLADQLRRPLRHAFSLVF